MQIEEANLQDKDDRQAIIELNKDFAVVSNATLATDHQDGLDELLRTHPTIFAFIARDEQGVAVGYALCHFTITSFAAGRAANVHDVFVADRVRGKGVGRALMTRFEEKARREGCRKLTLEISHDNTRAQGLYRDLGFGDDHPECDGNGTWFWFKMIY